MLSATPAAAATLTVNQCNNILASAEGATTGMECHVDVVNTISGGVTSSTTTVTRTCSLGPCPPGDGTFTSSSVSLVTRVEQCNASGNDAAHATTCSVSITNRISADTPGAQPVTAATVNQCVGTAGGGGGDLDCDPYPASTTGATITQCNGSANGGGGTARCTTSSTSLVSPAIPITVDQCNGTANPGGSVLTCSVSITTEITAAVTPTQTTTGGTGTGTATSTGGTGGTGTATSTGGTGTATSTGGTGTGTATTTGGTGTAAGDGEATTSSAPTQVDVTPVGGIQAGAGSPAQGPSSALVLSGLLLLTAAAGGGLMLLRSTRREPGQHR